MPATEEKVSGPRVLKAFIVRETMGDGCCVEFAAFNVVARRNGANELNTDFSGVECTRYPAFDQYAETGVVPDPVLIEHGWWYECMQCGQKICSNPTDEDGEEIELDPVYLPNRVFCKPQCYEAFKAERAAEAARADAAAAAAIAKWPGIEVTYKNGHECTQHPLGRVWFRFPGGQGTADWIVGMKVIFIEKRDQEAWKAFEDQLIAAKKIADQQNRG